MGGCLFVGSGAALFSLEAGDLNGLVEGGIFWGNNGDGRLKEGVLAPRKVRSGVEGAIGEVKILLSTEDCPGIEEAGEGEDCSGIKEEGEGNILLSAAEDFASIGEAEGVGKILPSVIS